MDDVTIIIPLHIRTEQEMEWAEISIRSALHQTQRVVAWDDASPLSCDSLLRKYGIDYGRSDTPRGPAFARNRAVERCDTEFIVPLDCDDYFHDSGIVAEMRRVYLQRNRTPTYANVVFVDEKGNIQRIHKFHEFNCKELSQELGVTSVTVFHSVEQWQHIGGWDENLDLFEDAEYNARLFAEYCGHHLSWPGLHYRQHTNQRTKRNKEDFSKQARNVLEIVRRRIVDMACCGKRKNSTNNVQKAAPPSAQTYSPSFAMATGAKMVQQTVALPGSAEDRAKAKYVGGQGKGSHYYRGRVTGHPYKVIHGTILSVDKRDIEAPGSLFQALERKDSGREPRVEPSTMKREPVEDKNKALGDDLLREFRPDHETVPDPAEMKVGAIKAFLEDHPEPAVVQAMVALERDGKERVTAISALESYLDERSEDS